MSLCHRTINKGLIYHSDRGCQYASSKFVKIAHENGITLSMSGKGNCYDNAVVESFFHTLKREVIQYFCFHTREEAIRVIFDYIEVFYNRKRLHSYLGYMSPEDYEKKWYKNMTTSS